MDPPRRPEDDGSLVGIVAQADIALRENEEVFSMRSRLTFTHRGAAG
jgi:hypothetical protein